ncbi:phage portal protein [Bacillus sp. AFS017336]|uniref:phage portal protein n=1 Tax=Bacillus sp. AFS017336 TaxID=2033489 RepID=UPI000BF044CB|nr:phage portal protein [Bacillus sp. AFS017336]PEL08311.1 phage portal protein [Bacillus sp. AFS017336]
MGLVDWIMGKMNFQSSTSTFELLNDDGEGQFTLGNTLFKNDVIRACIRPKANAIGKLKVTHVRENSKECKINPDPWVFNVLQEPNPFMSLQLLLEKMVTQLELNSNAFAFIKRNDFGYPTALFPIPCTTVEVLENNQGLIFLKFTFKNKNVLILPYSDIIHLRKDFNSNDLFGTPPYDPLLPLLEVIDSVDDSIVQNVSNNRFINWLLNFKEVLDQEEMIKNTNEFVNNYMKYTGDGVKAGFSEPTYSLQQVPISTYAPEAQRTNDAISRIYSFFNTNENIVRSTFDENQWNTYNQAVINPLVIQLNNEFTRKFFTPVERANGNRIVFEATNLEFASIVTKLAFSVMVERASLTPNEWRSLMGIGPIQRGNVPLLKTDTSLIDQRERDREFELRVEREKKREEEIERCREECREECKQFREFCMEQQKKLLEKPETDDKNN